MGASPPPGAQARRRRAAGEVGKRSVFLLKVGNLSGVAPPLRALLDPRLL